eukprot:COSAG02_NODE_2205_length_9519_cov_5.690446_1_plen_225_part_10
MAEICFFGCSFCFADKASFLYGPSEGKNLADHRSLKTLSFFCVRVGPPPGALGEPPEGPRRALGEPSESPRRAGVVGGGAPYSNRQYICHARTRIRALPLRWQKSTFWPPPSDGIHSFFACSPPQMAEIYFLASALRWHSFLFCVLSPLKEVRATTRLSGPLNSQSSRITPQASGRGPSATLTLLAAVGCASLEAGESKNGHATICAAEPEPPQPKTIIRNLVAS